MSDSTELVEVSSILPAVDFCGLVFRLVLEGQIHPRAESGDFAVYDQQVEFVHFRDTQVAQRFCCGFDGVFRGILPGTLAGTDELGNAVDAARTCILTHCILLCVFGLNHPSTAAEGTAEVAYDFSTGFARRTTV